MNIKGHSNFQTAEASVRSKAESIWADFDRPSNSISDGDSFPIGTGAGVLSSYRHVRDCSSAVKFKVQSNSCAHLKPKPPEGAVRVNSDVAELTYRIKETIEKAVFSTSILLLTDG